MLINTTWLELSCVSFEWLIVIGQQLGSSMTYRSCVGRCLTLSSWRGRTRVSQTWLMSCMRVGWRTVYSVFRCKWSFFTLLSGILCYISCRIKIVEHNDVGAVSFTFFLRRHLCWITRWLPHNFSLDLRLQWCQQQCLVAGAQMLLVMFKNVSSLLSSTNLLTTSTEVVSSVMAQFVFTATSKQYWCHTGAFFTLHCHRYWYQICSNLQLLSKLTSCHVTGEASET